MMPSRVRPAHWALAVVLIAIIVSACASDEEAAETDVAGEATSPAAGSAPALDRDAAGTPARTTSAPLPASPLLTPQAEAPTPAPTAPPSAPPTPAPTPLPTPAPTPAPQAACHPSYQRACLDPNASDYDCAGGSGNGPFYTGPVTVVGPDVFGLDRDGDGLGCE